MQIDIYNPFFIIIAFLLGLRYLAQSFLELLNRKNIHFFDTPPSSLKIDTPTYQKSKSYSLAKSYLTQADQSWQALILFSILIFGLLPPLWSFLESKIGSSLFAQATMITLSLGILQLLDLPFSWYSQFKLEAKFGFNTSTITLWLKDLIKSMLLVLLFGSTIFYVIIAFINYMPNSWYIWSVLFLVCFQCIMLVLYPYVLLPLFNKLSPLEEGELKHALTALASKGGYPAASIFVMDGSKRSSHSNAFFVGFGKSKRIVLFDTLIQTLSIEEIKAVVAHEIGHCKKNHIFKILLLGIFLYFLGFLSLHTLLHSKALLDAFSFSNQTGVAPYILIFSIYMPVLTFWFGPLNNSISRIFEFQADAFAKNILGTGQPLRSALLSLYKHNLSNLRPHPTYSTFYYSHPTLLERLNALDT